MNTTPILTTGENNITQKSFLRLVSVVASGLLLCVFLLIFLNPTLENMTPIFNMIAPGFFGVAHASPLLGFANDQNSPTADYDLAITKTHALHFIDGNKGVFTVTVKNVGSLTIDDSITVTDQLPPELTYNSSQGDGWNNCTGGTTLTCIHPSSNLISGNELYLFITVTVGQPSVKDVKNVVKINNITDTVVSNNIFSDTVDISADLAVNKTVQPSNPADGSVITYTLTVKNNGPNDTTGVVLTDTLPAKMTYIGSNTSLGSYTPSNGRWVIGNLILDQAVSLTITGTVNSGACGAFNNSTRGLTSNLPDGNPSNNGSSISVTINNTCLDGLVTVAVKGTPISTAGVSMKDSANHTYAVQTIASGWYTFTDTPSQPIASGAVTLTVTKSGYRTKTVITNVTAGIVNRQDVQLDSISDLVVSKTDNKTTVIPGETFYYTIGVTNTGTLTATTVVITDVLSSQLTYVLDDLFGQTGVISKTIDHTRIWTLTNGLLPGKGKIFTLQTRVANPLASGTIAVTNTVRARTTAIEDNTSDNVATDVDYTPYVSISKSVSPTEGKVNTRFTFSILVTNNGKVSMTNVYLNDVFPSYLTYYSGSNSKGGSISFNTSTRTFTAYIGTLTPSESATVTIYMTINSTTSSTQILYDTAAITYYHGGSYLTASSNTISYRILGSTSLPGTGGIPSEIAEQNRSAASAVWVAIICGILLTLGGLFCLRFGLKNRVSQWSSWALKMGSLLIFIGFLFGAVAGGFRFFYAKPLSSQPVFVAPSASPVELSPTMPVLLPSGDTVYAFQDHQTLPNYPVPTPTTQTTPGAGQPEDSTTPVRLLVPSLGIDAVVKYVPFDGFTWLISGLQNEIAWMGDTSWPGLGGNTALAGHVTLRNGADGPFRYLEKLKSGDEIAVFTEKNVYRYQVRELKTVPDSDMSITKPTQDTILTLITCTGWDTALGHYLERLIVLANLVEVRPLAASGN